MQDIEIGLNAANDIFETCCFGFTIQNKEAETERKRDGNSVIFLYAQNRIYRYRIPTQDNRPLKFISIHFFRRSSEWNENNEQMKWNTIKTSVLKINLIRRWAFIKSQSLKYE